MRNLRLVKVRLAMASKRVGTLALATVWALMAPGMVEVAQAQEAAAEEAEGRRIEEVIVTAERRTSTVQDTSIAITAFTGEFLEDFGIRNQEDLQNFVPATTIQPYDATIRGVGRNFRALGGDPGVATYMNEIYSEDLLTATAATLWDVERVEVLRGPQGTLYGRNAVGGALNILYKKPTEEFEGAVKTIFGNYATREYYGAVSGPLIGDTLLGRANFSLRERDGVINEIGPTEDLDGLGTENIALQLQWNPSDTFRVGVRQNFMDIDRSFGGANGGGLVVMNEDDQPFRNTTSLVPGFRVVTPTNTDMANYDQNDWYDAAQPDFTFTDPATGAAVLAQRNRAGIDESGFDGFQNAAASLDGFNDTSDDTALAYNACVFAGAINGDDLCAATNGLNREQFVQKGTQFNASWNFSDSVELKYLFGYNKLSYQRTTDDDNTASQFHDRQFYVNHEAEYQSHELQAFIDIREDITLTTGLFFYDATIDQRGDFYSSLGEARMREEYEDNTAMSRGAAEAFATDPDTGIVDVATADAVEGLSASTFAFQGRPMVNLFSAKNSCNVANPANSCIRNYSVENRSPGGRFAGLNFQSSKWYGDDGSDPALNVINGINSTATDLLYATKTEREAFAAYAQSVWDINDLFSLTTGIRFARDQVVAEENLFRYSETNQGGFLALYGGLAAVNRVNGGLVDDGTGNLIEPTAKATNGGIPYALSIYRPMERTDEKVTFRVNLDWNVSESAMMYYSVTTGYRSGGYNLVFFSEQPTYDPEELTAYEIGYKTRFFEDTLQVNGSFYYYDYESIHTVATQVNALGSNSTDVVEAPGAEIFGIEAEIIWLATDNLTMGGSLSYTPSEYTEDLLIKDAANFETPQSLFPLFQSQNIKGNQLLQVPESKMTAWATYQFALSGGSVVELFGLYSWIDDVYYSPFESEREKADSYGRLDLRATWRSTDGDWIVSGYVNNLLDEVGVLQVLRQGEGEHFRHTAGTTVPRVFGVELTLNFGNY